SSDVCSSDLCRVSAQDLRTLIHLTRHLLVFCGFISLGSGKKSGQQCGTRRHRVDENVLARGMRAVADGSEAVEGWDAERGGEISIRATADGAFAQGVIQLLRE